MKPIENRVGSCIKNLVGPEGLFGRETLKSLRPHNAIAIDLAAASEGAIQARERARRRVGVASIPTSFSRRVVAPVEELFYRARTPSACCGYESSR
jgi:hypothetical protein